MKTLQVTHQCFVLASITASLPHVTQSLTSKPWILDKNKQSLIQNMEGWVKVHEDTKEIKFKSAGVDEEEDGHTVEIVTNTEEQREAKEKPKTMPMNDFDEDVEVIVGTVETSTELKDKKSDRSGKVMLVREWKNRVVKIGENAGRRNSTSRTDIVKRPGVQLIEELLEDVNSGPSIQQEWSTRNDSHYQRRTVRRSNTAWRFREEHASTKYNKPFTNSDGWRDIFKCQTWTSGVESR